MAAAAAADMAVVVAATAAPTRAAATAIRATAIARLLVAVRSFSRFLVWEFPSFRASLRSRYSNRVLLCYSRANGRAGDRVKGPGVDRE